MIDWTSISEDTANSVVNAYLKARPAHALDLMDLAAEEVLPVVFDGKRFRGRVKSWWNVGGVAENNGLLRKNGYDRLEQRPTPFRLVLVVSSSPVLRSYCAQIISSCVVATAKADQSVLSHSVIEVQLPRRTRAMAFWIAMRRTRSTAAIST